MVRQVGRDSLHSVVRLNLQQGERCFQVLLNQDPGEPLPLELTGIAQLITAPLKPRVHEGNTALLPHPFACC